VPLCESPRLAYQSEVVSRCPRLRSVKRACLSNRRPSSDFRVPTGHVPDEVKSSGSRRCANRGSPANRSTRARVGRGFEGCGLLVISDEAGTRMGRISAQTKGCTVVGKDSAFGAFTAERSDVRLANAKSGGVLLSNDSALLKLRNTSGTRRRRFRVARHPGARPNGTQRQLR